MLARTKDVRAKAVIEIKHELEARAWLMKVGSVIPEKSLKHDSLRVISSRNSRRNETLSRFQDPAS